MSTTPYMSLILPTVSNTLGPTYATENNDAFTTVDAHDHTTGKGLPVPTAGININDDLTFSGFNATNLRSARLQTQNSPLGAVTDLGCIYRSGVDMWFNDGNGVQIQLTAGGALNAASIGGIGGDYTTSTASVFYTNSTKTFTFWQNTNKSALIDIGTILLRRVDNTSSAAITIRPDTSLSAGYTLTLPTAPPAATGPVMIDSSGNLSFLAAPSPTEMGYITGLTQSAQTQINRLRLEPGSTYNIGITYAAGVFTICAADASAFSSTAYGSICLPSTTAGQIVTLKTTANATFQDASGTSDLTNLEFGISAGSNWANDMPFFLYVANVGNANLDGSDGNSAYFISRSPCMKTTPSSVNDIWTTAASASNDTQNVIMLLGTYTVASYTSKPCQVIGAFRMRYATATHDWTVQALGNNDGIGLSQLTKTFSTEWTFPTAQNSAAVGGYIANNGGTAPSFTSNTYTYLINEVGDVHCLVRLTSDGGTDGSGAVSTNLCLPYTNAYNATKDLNTIGVNSGLGANISQLEMPSAVAYTNIITPSTGVALLNSNFPNGDRWIFGQIDYKAY